MRKWFFVSILFIILFHQTVLANYWTSDGLEWSIVTKGGEEEFAYIEGYTGNETNMTIPSSVEGRPVIGIGMYALSDNTNLVSVILPPTINTIQNGAFEGCTNLQSITIPESVTYIGNWAFDDCPNLTTAIISKSVRHISDYAFGYYNSFRYKTNLTIYGYYGTMAESYAKSEGFNFVGTRNNIAEVAEIDNSSIEDEDYNGRPIKQKVELYISWYGSGLELVNGVDYKVSYRNNVYPGTATIVVTGINHYYGTITGNFKIYQIPIRARLTSVNAKTNKNIVTISWKKSGNAKQLAQVKSIQVQYDTDRSFMHAKSKNINKNSTNIVFKLPKKKQTYYIRVRFIGWDGVSKWSGVKKVKTK